MRISTKLLTLNLLLMLMFTTVVLAAVLIQGNNLATTGSKIRMENNLDYTNSMMKLYISNAEEILDGYADDPAIKDHLKDGSPEILSYRQELSKLVSITNELENIAVIGDQGIARASDMPISEENFNHSGKKYHANVMSRRDTYVSGVIKNPDTGDPTIAVAVPVMEKAEILGYVVGMMDLDKLAMHLKRLQDESELLVLDRNGDPVISTEYDFKNLNRNVLFEDYNIYGLREKIEDQFSFTETDIHGSNYIVGYKEYDLFTLIYAKQSNVIYFMIYSIFMTVMGFSAILLLLFGFLIYFTSGTIARPIKELSNKVDKITKGNLDIQLKKSNILEIDNLIDSLNRILASLKLAILRTGARKSDFGIGQALQAKKKAEKRFSIIFESAPRGIFTVKDKKVTSWNKRAAQITGYSDSEVVGKDASLFVKDLDHCLKDNINSDRRECTFKTKDGKDIIVALNKEKIEDDTGEMLEEIIIFDDITSRAKKEKETDFKIKEMYALMEEMNDLIYVSDMENYEIIYANRSMRRAFGDDVVGKKCHEVILGSSKPCGSCINAKVKELNGKPYVWEYRNPILNKRFQLTDRMIKWPDGRCVRFEIAHDITEMREMEERLLETENREKTILDSIPAMVWITDKKGRFIDANKLFLKNAEITKKQLIGKTAKDIVPKRYADKYRKDNEQVIRTGESMLDIVEEAVTSKGKARVMKVDKIPYFKDGKIEGVIGFGQDITDQQRIDQIGKQLNVAMDFPHLAWWEMDLSGKIEYNQNKLKMLGYPKSKLKTYKDLLQLVHPDDQDKVRRSLEGLIEGKKKKLNIQYRIKTKSGEHKKLKHVGVVCGSKVVGLVGEVPEKT